MAALQHLTPHQFRTPGVSSKPRRTTASTLSIFGKPTVTSGTGPHGQHGIVATSVPDFRSQHTQAHHRPYRRH